MRQKSYIPGPGGYNQPCVEVVKLVVRDMEPRHRIGVPCYKIFGADVLVTRDLQPHVLEASGDRAV